MSEFESDDFDQESEKEDTDLEEFEWANKHEH